MPVRGTNKLRRTLRRVDPLASKGVKGTIRRSSEAIVADAIRLAPRDEGDLARSIDYKLGRDGMTSVIGPGAKAVRIAQRRGGPFSRVATARLSKGNKELIWQFMKAYWYELGTKGAPSKGIPPQPAQPFMAPAWDLNRDWAQRQVRAAVKRALQQASRG